ncbi:DNA-directed RNA polymerase subunit alpha C-terminal domain-containing protein [Cohnella panacarvi]|uniref:DNA-directed RNA polymerase subunit alpha C-terminal domain-containing protein n=1 Tax=Cohnella panacarvi TaxID=400776 RepID=UPI00047EA8BC|nr:DNA-directed RNA polymerase subunit alpha C-terminal domain-containing protein [Cohnella panacarvi]
MQPLMEKKKVNQALTLVYSRFLYAILLRNEGNVVNYMTRLDPIEKLNLSTRAYHALRRAGIYCVGDLMDFPKENFPRLKNLGVKTITEIIEVIEQIEIIESNPLIYNTERKTEDELVALFIGKDGLLYRDVPIEDIELSKRSFNCLKGAGIDYISKLLDKTEADLFAIPNMGAKSVKEITEAINLLVLEPAPAAQSSPNDDSVSGTDELCLYIVQEVVKTVRVHAGQLYKDILALVENCNGRFVKADSAVEIDGELISELYGLSLLRCAIKDTFLKQLESNPYGLDKFHLVSSLPSFLQNEVLVDSLLSELIQDGNLLCLHAQMYRRKYPTALEYAASLPKPQECAVLTGRLYGQTLDSIGNDLSLSRQRIQQIETKCIRKAPTLSEDLYALVYQKYDITKKDFLIGFKESEITYNYLAIAYNKGEYSIDELATDSDFPDYFKKAAERIIYKNYVVLGSERVLCSRSELSEYILRTAGVEGLTFEEFSQLYKMLLEDLNLQDNPKFSVMDRGYANKLAASNHVLWKYGQKLRYYNIDAYDYTDLFNGLNLNDYMNVEFSTRKLFQEYPELMSDYDIQDEYELHNLLKKICSEDEYPDIHFKRMPNIEFGVADRDTQLMDMLLALAPIRNTEFAAAYEQAYGVLSQTVLANYMKNFDQYFYSGVYKIDVPMLSDIMAAKMKQLLSSEFYLLSDIRKMYVREFPQDDPKLLNPYTLKALGFRVYANYAIKDQYSSATEYFRAILTTEDIVDAQSFPKEMLNTVAYTGELYKLKAAYEILEYAPLKYVHFRRLNRAGVEKESILDYCHRAYQAVDSQYFTVYSLREKGFTHILDELGFDEWFYASLLSEDKEHFSCRRMGKNKLFRRDSKNVSLVDFLEWILYSNESLSLDVRELVEKLLSEYNIRLEWYKIVEAIKGSVMYYDTITQKVYADYDIYFEEI